MNTSKKIDALLFLWYVVFFVSIACCFRAISSIAIGLILLTSLVKNKKETGNWLNINLKNGFLWTCCFFFVLQSMVLLYPVDLLVSRNYLQLKTGIFLIPLAICCNNYLNETVRERLMRYYIGTLTLTLFYCLVIATRRYFFMEAPADVFFYHELLSPFHQHAIQVSLLFFIGLIYLLEKIKNGLFLVNKSIHFLLLFYFTVCILLLSSKLLIAFSAGSLIYYFIIALKTKPNIRVVIFVSLVAILSMILLVLTTQNRVSKRFNEIISGEMAIVQQQDYDPAIYFNGLQFRLLQARFVKEILTGEKAWLTGVSYRAQELLDKKYISTHMYIGDGRTADKGYLGYNTHNQFLQSVLQSGIAGLIVFIFICYYLIRLALRRRNRELTLAVLILLAYSFNESVFETQYGIILFTFFPLFLYFGTKAPAEANALNNGQKDQ